MAAHAALEVAQLARLGNGGVGFPYFLVIVRPAGLAVGVGEPVLVQHLHSVLVAVDVALALLAFKTYHAYHPV